MNELSIKLSNISVSFGNKDIFDIENMSAYMNDRIAVVGRNGIGKSTLLKIIAGEFKEFTGEVQRETEFNYLSQIGELNRNIDETLDFEMLSRMNVPDNAKLSGGEETKFRLVQTLSDYKTGLLLDEPTTHLDQESIEYLISELEYYYGTLIFVSHDRHFINSLATKIWEVSDGTVTEYTGNYTEYEEIKNKEKLEQEREHENVNKERTAEFCYK
ncbi:ATP-binding cassette domain-containing protein [Jeotgalicoccus sp. WY2]|uniref:ATP-binding cassette domain-containing protein n=1 Tax=Jeotgalicoccus sp. WY2 TaxID=2708346 RepID=UPI002021DADC|nr:ATP-binding cassette domain-containing protein [Jeotgalicoccus sp. WY2]